MPATIHDVLRTLTADPGRPRLTWYGPDGERIELSGAVLANWVAKTTNLLVEEFDAEPGSVVASDLPPHWRTLVWALATWQSGAELRVVDGPAPTGGSPADVIVTAAPDRWLAPDGRRPATGDLVVVSLPALARRYGGDLPAGAVDAASAVMTYADVVGYSVPTDLNRAALSGPTVTDTVRFDALLSWSAGAVPAGSAATVRRLVRPGPGARGTLDLLRTSLGTWAVDGSVVILEPGTARDLDADPDRLARLVATERITS